MYRLKTLMAVSSCTRKGVLSFLRANLFTGRTGSTGGATHSVRNYALPVTAEPFLNGSSSSYVEEMYVSWQKDPNSVHKVSSGVAIP